jgi:hypothetical protein
MYTRQADSHLAGLDDARIREVVICGMRRRPGLVRIHRLFRAAVMIGMVLATALLARLSSLEPGMILLLVGAVATATVLSWSLVWVHTILYRVTLEEVGPAYLALPWTRPLAAVSGRIDSGNSAGRRTRR